MAYEEHQYNIVESSEQGIVFENTERERTLEADFLESKSAGFSRRYGLGEINSPEEAHLFEVNDPDSSLDSVSLEVHEADIHYGGKRLAKSIDERYDELI